MEKFYILELEQFGEMFPHATMVTFFRVQPEYSVFLKFDRFIIKNNSVFHFLYVYPSLAIT